MLLLPLVLLERLLLDDGEEEELTLCGTFIASPLDEEVSWLLLCSLPPLLWSVQLALAFMAPADAAAPAAAALAMAPRLSKHPSNSVVARMAIKPPKATA